MKLKHLLAILAGIAIAIGGFFLHKPPPPAPSSPCHTANGLPDPICTPGVVRTTDLNIICHQTTAPFRPPVSYTNRLKIKQIKEYGYSDTNPANYEEDHMISLELGGDGYDPKNLWPEPHTGLNNSFDKDKIENLLHKRICNGTITPQEAQKEILIWTTVK